MLKNLKRHWFGVFITLFALVYGAILTVILISPRQDLQNRGFIPCTKELVKKMGMCKENKAWCFSKLIVQNHFCDLEVIAEGVQKWANGAQPRPWSNYIFDPELPENEPLEDAELLEEFYQNNPDIEAQMERLNQERLKLESQLTEKQNDAELPK